MASEAAVAQTIREFFLRAGWLVADEPDETAVVRVVVDASSGRWPLGVWVTDDLRIVVYSVLPEPVHAKHRRQVVELLSELNAGLLLGCFELDPGDDLVRFRTSIGVRGVEITNELLRELVYPNVAAVESYLEAVSGCADGSLTLKSARQLIAGSS